jgi:pantetheine-phosphate adenylyltransferase
MPVTALYPGTFDPMHNGHLDITRRALRMFDKVVIGVYDLPSKKLLFGHEDRIELARKAVAGLEHGARATVQGYGGLTVNFAKEMKADVMLRGLRNSVDFDYELQLAMTNQWLAHGVETVCMFTSVEHAFISATLVREVTQLGGDPTPLVPPPVAEALRRIKQ